MMENQNEPKVWSNHRLWGLSIGETLAWAGLFYIFPASLLSWRSHFEWSISELSVALMLALIVSAISGIGSGKLIDKGYGRELMSFGAVMGGICLWIVPMVDSLELFYFLWALIGIAMGACLYDPCFAILTREYSLEAKKPIVMVTILAGFSITFCFIFTAAISSFFGWQFSFYIFGFLLCFVVAPLFWLGISADRKERNINEKTLLGAVSTQPFLRELISKPIFWGLSIMFAAFALNHIMIISQILPLFETKGASSTSAILIASAMGPMQVSGRIGLLLIEKQLKREFDIVQVAIFSCVILICGSGILYYSETSIFMLGAFVVFQGVSFGIINLVKPVIVATLLGESDFGFIAAFVGVGYIIGFAVAPGVSGLISDVWGLDGLISMTFLIAILGLIAFSSVALKFRNTTTSGG
ncbi:MAG: MFS transporter [Chloroflexota bacterium]|nr:MFS transporter [Chloroflexota bacterium]